ncbi:MAG: MFS transporter [Gaiellaceae bacterium]
MRVPTRFAALQEREFRLLFFGQVVSLVGDTMAPVALAFAVLDLTGSAGDLGYVFAAKTLPLVAFLLVGGVFADRLPRRAVMLGADLVRFCSQGAAALLLVTGHAQLWHLIVLQALHGTATAFFNPAATGLTPMTVSGERLQQANGLRGLAQAASVIVGPAIAGGLVAGVGSGWAIGVDAATFAVSACFLAQLRLPAHIHLPPQSFLRDLREGWQEFSSRTWVWVVVVCASLGNAASAGFVVLGPAISKESLGGPGAWALILVFFGIGSFVGGLLALHLTPERPLLVGTLALLLAGSPSALLALGMPALAVAAGALCAGAGLLLFNTLWETALQEHVPRAALSRVSAYDWFGSLAIQPLGLAIIGPASGLVGQDAVLWAAAAISVASTLAMLATPSVRQLESRVRPEPASSESLVAE